MDRKWLLGKYQSISRGKMRDRIFIETKKGIMMTYIDEWFSPIVEEKIQACETRLKTEFSKIEQQMDKRIDELLETIQKKQSEKSLADSPPTVLNPMANALHCPFCNSVPKFKCIGPLPDRYAVYIIQCTHCFARTDTNASPLAAVAQWNQRHEGKIDSSLICLDTFVVESEIKK